jgi:hypothetical protein
MPNLHPQNFSHTKLYRSLKQTFQKKKIPLFLFRNLIQDLRFNYGLVDWDASDIGAAFSWEASIQGHLFWAELYHLIQVFPIKRD